MNNTQSFSVSSLGQASVSLLFVAMAALQINDPDPLLWLCTYLMVATIPAAGIFGFRLPAWFWTTVGMITACLIVSFPGFVAYVMSGDFASVTEEMSVEKPYIEPAREFLGIGIGAVCLLFYRNWHQGSG